MFDLCFFKDVPEIERHVKALLDWRQHIDQHVKLLEEKMAIDLSKLNAAIAAAEALIAQLKSAPPVQVPTTDPADQTSVDAAAASLQAAVDAAKPAA